jgi:cytochrome c-type biogenesis protein CcmH/NrfG
MSYAYFQGQEAQALEYYKQLLSLAKDEKARKEIEKVIQELELAVATQEQSTTAGTPGVHNAYFA